MNGSNSRENIGAEKIAKYLGLKNIHELASILSEVLGESIQPDVDLIYHRFNYFLIDSKSNKYDPNDEFSGLRQILFNGNHVGWRCILSYDEDNFKDYEENRPSFFGRLRDSINPLDIGHILALELFSFIKQDSVWIKQNGVWNKEKPEEICNSQKYNLVPQFKRANENSRDDVGQARFENWLHSELMNHEGEQVYYEVEEIFKNTNDIVPIGTRIFACKYGTTPSTFTSSYLRKLILPFHVFIPNYGFIEEEGKGKVKNKNFDSNYLLDKLDKPGEPKEPRNFYKTCCDKWKI